MPGPLPGRPRRPQRRIPIGLRLSEAGLTQIDELAATLGWQRSETIRALLTAAINDPTTLNRVRDRTTTRH